MADLSVIRTALATSLATVTAFRNAYATWPDQVTTPCVIVMPRRGNWREALAGVPMFAFEIWVLAAPWGDRGLPRAQDALDALLDDTGAQSVHAAIRGDVTLGGTAHTCDVVGFDEYGAMELVNGIAYLGCKVAIDVWA